MPTTFRTQGREYSRAALIDSAHLASVSALPIAPRRRQRQAAASVAEHFDCYTWHRAPKLAKSESAIAETANDHWLPATLNYPDRRVNGTLVPLDIGCTVFAHV